MEIDNETDKYSLRGRVYDHIREGFLRGQYRKNEELREVSLAKELGVSRTPIREALRQLELEGLVNIIPNKGAYVIGITKKDISDIYEMRSRLEGLCARWAATKITESELEMLREICDLSDYYAGKDRFDKILDLDNRFHEVLYEAADSRMLKHTLSHFHQYIEMLRKRTLSSKERVEASMQEHRQILDAISRKDEDSAEKLAHMHMINTIHNIEEKHLLDQ